jgi:hypothetical protein
MVPAGIADNCGLKFVVELNDPQPEINLVTF